MGKAAFCALSLIVCAFERNSSFVRSGVAELFALGEYRSTRPSPKSPAPCCDQNWLIPSARANSSSRTAALVRRLGSARENRKELSSLSVLLCLKRAKPDRENCGGLGGVTPPSGDSKGPASMHGPLWPPEAHSTLSQLHNEFALEHFNF